MLSQEEKQSMEVKIPDVESKQNTLTSHCWSQH